MDCRILNCSKPRKKGRTLCSMHAGRVARHGSPDVVLWSHRRIGTNGYIILSGYHGHPLAQSRGEVYEHRLVLYEAIGAGRHDCVHCSLPVVWEDRTLVVDHLDWDTQNNERDNLVPSCLPCNQARQQQRFPRAPGSCQWCGQSYVGYRVDQKWCSGACRNRAYRARRG